jgi:hypothetical protein
MLRGAGLTCALLAGCSAGPAEAPPEEERETLRRVVKAFQASPMFTASVTLGNTEIGRCRAQWFSDAGSRAIVEIDREGKNPILLIADGSAAVFSMKSRTIRGAVPEDFGDRLRGLVSLLGLLPAATMAGHETGRARGPSIDEFIRDAKILRREPGHLTYRLAQMPGYEIRLTYDPSTGLPLSRFTLLDGREINREDWEVVVPGLPNGTSFTLPP